MRIATRLTLALSAVAFLLFGAYAVSLLGAESDKLRETAYHELRLLGRSLQAALEHALRDDQLGDIAETLGRLEQVEPLVHVTLFRADGSVQASTRGASPGAMFEGRAAQDTLRSGARVLREAPEGSADRLLLALPLNDDAGERLGALVVVRPISDINAALREAQRNTLLSVVLFVLLAAIVGRSVGHVLISQPIDRLIDAFARVRAGDLRPSRGRFPRDELGRLAREFDTLVEELDVARERLRAEELRRRMMDQRLQRADKLITLGQLAASLAHEIGSPLQVVVGRARALAEREYAPERVRHHAEIIAAQAEAVAGTVEQLLAYSRRRAARVEPTDLVALVHGVIDLLDVEAHRAGVGLSLSTAPDLPLAHVDPGQMQQVVFNLLRNALQASPSGGEVHVDLKREALDPQRSRAGGAGVVIQVTDSGPGVPEADRERIFEAFVTTRGDEGGTGLGLSVVRSLVHEHRGYVTVTDGPDGGARFSVHLPLDPEDPHE